MLAAAPAFANDTVYYYHTDAQGTAVVVTDASHHVVERTYYGPYGEVLNRPLRDGPGYTGHEEDAATGLDNMQQRYYDPQADRFPSPDPMEVDTTTGGNFNRYAYANDNPYRYTDPDGRQTADTAKVEQKRKDWERNNCTGSHICGGATGALNVKTISFGSYRKGADTRSDGRTSNSQDSSGNPSANSAGNPSGGASGQNSEGSSQVAKAPSGWVNGLYYCQPNCIQPGPALDAESNKISNSYWPIFFGPPAAGAVVGTFPTVGPVVGSAAVRYGPRAIMAGCIALACKNGDLPDKYAEDRVMLQKIYEEAKEVGGDLYKQVLESNNGH